MPKRSPFPNHPVRVLRNEFGFSSAEAFAKHVGIPAETIRNAEQGRRPITEDVALQIGAATGASTSWLRSGNAVEGKPIDQSGKTLTKERFEEFAGLKAQIAADPDDGDIPEEIGGVCYYVTVLLRAALRKGKYPQCHYRLWAAVKDAEKQFNLTKPRVRENQPLLNSIAKELYRNEARLPFDFGDYINASNLLSHTTEFQWEAELRDKTIPEKSDILARIELLQKIVKWSLDRQQQIKPRSKKSSRPSRRQAQA